MAPLARLRGCVAATLIVTGGALAGNCYAPDVADCTIACGAENACPDGQLCEQGRCTSHAGVCLPSGQIGDLGGSGGEGGKPVGTGGQMQTTGGSLADTGGAPGSGASPACQTADCGEPPSCQELPDCGGVSCCTSIALPQGRVLLGRSTSGSDAFDGGISPYEVPEHLAFVSAFKLDRFEVSAGRFRRFVTSYTGEPPEVGAGAHPRIEGSGWKAAWNSALPVDRDQLEQRLACTGVNALEGAEATYSATPGTKDELPIVCVDWYVAFAFCVWDGGRLPTETEWEYAAAGGLENRLFAWGDAAIDNTRASYDCQADGWCAAEDLRAVDAYPAGRGRWGHNNLTGNAWEWVLDYDRNWYPEAAASGDCEDADCMNLVEGVDGRMTRGGGFTHLGDYQRVAHRGGAPPEFYFWTQGLRCARDL